MANMTTWTPPDFSRPDAGKPGEIKAIFSGLFNGKEYKDLADRISRYWIERLEAVWREKAQAVKKKDMAYTPGDPLSRIRQKTVLISYADSVQDKSGASLACLDKFLSARFPAIQGLHILPACEIAEDRFNDGGFSQITRDRIHAPYGTNRQFESMMEKYFSMADFVLNHVDMDNPRFRQYLEGDDRAGYCFFVFSEEAFQKRLARGDFRQIFRPRPFPLFTIFRRTPRGIFNRKTRAEKTNALNQKFESLGLMPLPGEVIDILSIFHKIKNDQMLLSDDNAHLTRFRTFLAESTPLNPDDLFVISETQETQHPPYIFQDHIHTISDLFALILPSLEMNPADAHSYTRAYTDMDTALFGEPVRVLTTFSHVQVDLNTTTYEGLKLLIDDFSWYLKMDLNMLRLDAANFAFKKWGTSCFGLPEGSQLMKILYLSMDMVSPRIVPNLEVNAPLGLVLKQMADKKAPPPMMYDFHLASMLPVVFNTADARPLLEIFKMIDQYDIPHESIRFSLDESHDGKSVNGSGGADPLLTYEARRNLIHAVRSNNGHVKYKSTPIRQIPAAEFKKISRESSLDAKNARRALFKASKDDTAALLLKASIQTPAHIAEALGVNPDRLDKESALNFLKTKLLEGREPYELCISTRDALIKLKDPVLVVKRYLAFKTLSFALMGRNVKAIYFNDLMGLGNDPDLVEKTGELRNIKRTKSSLTPLEQALADPACVASWIAGHMNNTIALVDADPSFDPRGDQIRLTVTPEQPSIALVRVSYQHDSTLVVVNTAQKAIQVDIALSDHGMDDRASLFDHISGKRIQSRPGDKTISLTAGPFDRFWLKPEAVHINPRLLVHAGSNEEMRKVEMSL